MSSRRESDRKEERGPRDRPSERDHDRDRRDRRDSRDVRHAPYPDRDERFRAHPSSRRGESALDAESKGYRAPVGRLAAPTRDRTQSFKRIESTRFDESSSTSRSSAPPPPPPPRGYDRRPLLPPPPPPRDYPRRYDRGFPPPPPPPPRGPIGAEGRRAPVSIGMAEREAEQQRPPLADYEVPSRGYFFEHDDRGGNFRRGGRGGRGGSRGGGFLGGPPRQRGGSPKWGHDGFEKLSGAKSATTTKQQENQTDKHASDGSKSKQQSETAEQQQRSPSPANENESKHENNVMESEENTEENHIALGGDEPNEMAGEREQEDQHVEENTEMSHPHEEEVQHDVEVEQA